MEEKEFLKLVKKDRYQVFLFGSKMPRPIGFALHTWFVINKKGKIFRWDAGLFVNKAQKSWGNVHLNVFKNPTMGMTKRWKDRDKRHKSKIIGSIEGKKGSIAERIIKFIEKDVKDYPFKNKYKMHPGPNSNTFTQWVISHFPKSGLKLPWNAFGKNWKGLKN